MPPPPFEIGLTDLPKSEGAAPPLWFLRLWYMDDSNSAFPFPMHRELLKKWVGLVGWDCWVEPSEPGGGGRGIAPPNFDR